MNAILKEKLQALEYAAVHRIFPVPPARDLHPHELLQMVLSQRFGVEYQPVVEITTGETMGFEALARFYRANGEPVASDSVFGLLHNNPLLLFHTEMAMKKLQILHAPPTGILFLNLDPDSFHAGQAPGFNVFTDMFCHHQLPGRELIVEVIENLHIRDVALTSAMIGSLQDAGIKMAVDDLGVSNGLLSFGSFCNSSFIKFDRSWISGHSNRKLAVMEWFIEVARAAGARTVLEGVETPADLALARDMGFDCVQGFYFRDRFVSARPWHET